MRITDISVKNFRALIDVSLKKANKINVIVGPNAAGKSTVLEAIRLCKTLLSNRYNEEGNQVLVNLSAMSANFQILGGPSIDLLAIANDSGKTVDLKVDFLLEEGDIANLVQNETAFAMAIIQNSLASTKNDPLAFTQYLSSSEGQKKLQNTAQTVRERLKNLSTGTNVSLNLIMDPTQKVVRGTDEFAQTVIAMLDRRLPIQKTIMSLFPADRQFPQGEQNLQLGSADAQNQLSSYMSNPSLKYARLTQVIMQHVAFGAQGFQYVQDEFNLIFDNLLPGKKLHGINVNMIGLLKVLVIEQSTQKVFDIDQMSSGEKGLILTFLFIRLSVEKGGVVLLDEPELHLNSLVQSRILKFVKDYIAINEIQVFICTHSPEIVKYAFEDDECNLYHLRSGVDLSPIHFNDHIELFDVFERLGNSPSDVLFTRGNVFVEGVDDNHVLQAGYAEQTIGYKIDPLGGRAELEKEFPILQNAERDGILKKKQLFIIDNDRNPTQLKSSNLVRIHQHDRYCFENYLLDEDILYELIRNNAKIPPESRAVFSTSLENIALSQIEIIAIKDVYKEMKPGSLSLTAEDTAGKSLGEIAEVIAVKFDHIGAFLAGYQRQTWVSNFVFSVDKKKAEMLATWKKNWRKLASGKDIIDELYRRHTISMRKTEFKKEIIRRMASSKTDDWRVLDHVLRSELS